MTRACCPSCRARFSPDTAANLLACPFCGGPLDRLPAQEALGLRLIDERKLDDRAAAVDLAFRALETDRDRRDTLPPWPPRDSS